MCLNTLDGDSEENKPCVANLRVAYSENPTLPDPREQWVDMAYYVRDDPTGSGLVKIYANGEWKATVSGSIGYREGIGEGEYFKVGNYRDFIDGTATLYFDDFHRTSVSESLEGRE